MRPGPGLLDRLGLTHPIVQAPMIGPRARLAAAVTAAGGLGSLACAAFTPEQVREEVAAIRRATDGPFNLNFFCHRPAAPDPEREAAWRARLGPAYREFDLDPQMPIALAQRRPFDAAMCACVEALAPRVVSFHFGLPEEALLARVRAAGCLVLASATTAREARWLGERGVDAVIAQGAEAGGHRGTFLGTDPAHPGVSQVASQVGALALVPQVVDVLEGTVPVIAAGGIADGRGVAAVLALGAAAAQVGSAYLLCPEAETAAHYRQALEAARDEDTAVTNVFTGRPARGLFNRALREFGPLSAEAPAFPGAAVALQPLRAAAEAAGSGAFSPLWSGQAIPLAARGVGAAALTRDLAAGAARALSAALPRATRS